MTKHNDANNYSLEWSCRCCVDTCTCMPCTRRMLDIGDDAQPCSCEPVSSADSCCARLDSVAESSRITLALCRWCFLSCLSILCPILCCYWPLMGCVACCEGCQRMVTTRHACHCRRSFTHLERPPQRIDIGMTKCDENYTNKDVRSCHRSLIDANQRAAG